MDKYRQAEGLSGSRLGLLHQCPQKFKYEQDNPKEPTEAMRFGSLCHMAVLEPHLLSSQIAVAPQHCIDGKKQHRELDDKKLKAYTNFVAENPGVQCMLYKEYQDLMDQMEAFNSNPDCANIMAAKGTVEMPVFWEEEGVKCKGKLDKYLSELNVITDFKTTNDASPKQFYWKVTDFGYLLQLAHYQAGVRATLGLDAYPGVLIMAQETDAPYVSQVYEVPQVEIDQAHERRRELLAIYKTCKGTGIWPGYGEGILTLERK